MLYSDKPIYKAEEDLLNRLDFSKRLASAIFNYNQEDTLTISLEGAWGSGKTSILNLTLQEIDNLMITSNSDTSIKPILFNPWNFTNSTQLINQFFLLLTNSLHIFDKNNKKIKLVNKIEKYAQALDYVDYVPSIAKKGLSRWVTKYKRYLEFQMDDISSKKKDVENALKELCTRILIVIDDIDRLPNDQIRLIFQLVSSLAHFPNVTYLLLFDRTIVVNALQHVQTTQGEKYLEKIVQLPFSVPEANTGRIDQILLSNLNPLLASASNQNFDNTRWRNVFDYCIHPFIKSMRDVKRYYNKLYFTFTPIKDEVDFIDMAAICCLQLHAPHIHQWIYENKQLLTKDLQTINDKSREQIKNEISTRFQELNYPSNSSDFIWRIITALFPNYNSNFFIEGGYGDKAQLYRDMRLASPERFDLFFGLSLKCVEISREEINRIIFDEDYSQISSHLVAIRNRNLYEEFSRYLKYFIPNIPRSRIHIIAQCFIEQNAHLPIGSGNLFSPGYRHFSAYTVLDLLYLLEEESRFELLLHLFRKDDFTTFQYLLNVLHLIELSHGRIRPQEDTQAEKLISLDHLLEIEQSFLERTLLYIKETNIFDWTESRRLSFLWPLVDEESYKSYMKDLLSNDIMILKYVAMSVTTWRDAKGVTSYSFQSNTRQDFFSDTFAKQVIDRIRLSDTFWNLDYHVIEACCAFSLYMDLNTQTDSTRIEEIDIANIRHRLSEWKEDFKKFRNSI